MAHDSFSFCLPLLLAAQPERNRFGITAVSVLVEEQRVRASAPGRTGVRSQQRLWLQQSPHQALAGWALLFWLLAGVGLYSPVHPVLGDAALCMKCRYSFRRIPPCIHWVLRPALRDSSAECLLLSLSDGHCRASGRLWLKSEKRHGSDKDARGTCLNASFFFLCSSTGQRQP